MLVKVSSESPKSIMDLTFLDILAIIFLETKRANLLIGESFALGLFDVIVSVNLSARFRFEYSHFRSAISFSSCLALIFKSITSRSLPINSAPLIFMFKASSASSFSAIKHSSCKVLSSKSLNELSFKIFKS